MAKRKFQEGDKVKFKQDLIVDQQYGSILYISGMDFHKKEVWNINCIKDEEIYVISCKNSPNWNVSPEMIEPYVEEQSKCCEGKTVNCTEPTTQMKKELELPKEAFEENVLPKEPSFLIARKKNRKIYYIVDKPIC